MKMRNPKLLGLIRKGCSITFPSGVIFHRIPDSEFIESGMMGESSFGQEELCYKGIDTYDLSEEGLEEALDYEEGVAFNLEDDEELSSEELEEEMP